MANAGRSSMMVLRVDRIFFIVVCFWMIQISLRMDKDIKIMAVKPG
jgi:uncharacterized membrane protein YwzB